MARTHDAYARIAWPAAPELLRVTRYEKVNVTLIERWWVTAGRTLIRIIFQQRLVCCISGFCMLLFHTHILLHYQAIFDTIKVSLCRSIRSTRALTISLIPSLHQNRF